MSLTRKRQVFVCEYLACWNATEAARRAGYAHPNMAGPRLLVNDSVSQKIKARIDEKAMSADEVLLRLAEQARNSIGEFLILDGNTWRIDLAKVKENGHLIKSLKDGTHGVEIDLHDAQAALVHLGRTHGLFVDRSKSTIDLNVVDRDELSRKLDSLAAANEADGGS